MKEVIDWVDLTIGLTTAWLIASVVFAALVSAFWPYNRWDDDIAAERRRNFRDDDGCICGMAYGRNPGPTGLCRYCLKGWADDN